MDKYVVSARKYRPESFDTVVGQEHVTKTLLNEIRNNHLAQAFLFNGPRGVGKTTCARILAREINKGSIEDSEYDYSYNIFELDAASNNSVDDIRLLNEQVRIPPQIGSYKVYIIDEVHMLSASAFNAFLKTLEEPPPYAVFILATTERHKILPTILSRCQVFNFNRIAVKDMVSHLQEIADKESIKAEEEALHIIAQKADGALRDALSIFDQMVSIGDGAITYSDVIENLSVLDYDHYFELTDAFANQDIAAVLNKFDALLDKGFDGQIFLNGLSSHFRDLMVVRDERSMSLLEVPPHVKSKYYETGKKLSMGFLVNAINLANKYDLGYKASRNQRLHVELALIKICYLNALTNPAEVAEKKKPELKPSAKTPDTPEIKEDEANKKKGEGWEKILEDQQSVTNKNKPDESKFPKPSVSQESQDTETENPKEKKKVEIPPLKDAKVARLGDLDAILGGSSPETTEMKNESIGEEKPTESNRSEPEEQELENKEFTRDNVLAVLKDFEEDLLKSDQTRLAAIMKFMDVVYEQGTTIEIRLNKQHRIQLEEIRVDLQLYLRKELSNRKLLIEWVEVKKKVEDRRAYTSQEKFEAMAKKNPNLQKLKDDLQLNIE